ncbi:Xaa-Pro dipeptidase [Roseibium hamelinense]|uniref:Xaa-Pro dipeptidase n=1 Tax=Roseibium hamelinense TaxID=150831 RepID=A0A562STS8_9HYPH|nr:Xaa-Pro peptidase family protein [Roseibium hamelinense]MTI43212.1 aminopeptidase P family protein [Roseibium hamelinense]TWI84737.1 Xaa-Pro dipeptidase [Roseibium hamelinense]
MTNAPAFPKEELDRRVAKACDALAGSDLDGILISVPESIYYLTGMDHWGFFAAHVLVMNRNGEMALCCRAMERITFDNQVSNARFYGHKDHEELADYVHAAMRDLGLTGGRVGIEKRSLFLHIHHGENIMADAKTTWLDASGVIDDLRLVKSELEMDYTRKAARAADLGTIACINALRDGATDYEVAAEYMRASILEGSEYPGFGPFIRPTTRLGEEHTTWRGETFKNGDAVFLETCAAYRKYQAPMGRLVYVGSVPPGIEKSVETAKAGMNAICHALQPGAKAGDAYDAWREVACSAGLNDYHRHHCGYLVGIGFPPSWTGGSMVTSLFPHSERTIEVGMVIHAHSWFTNTAIPDYFISNTVLVTEKGGAVLTAETPDDLIIR